MISKLEDLAALPAQPCLASQIETGTAVDPDTLHFIEAVELALHGALGSCAALRILRQMGTQISSASVAR